MNVAEIWRYPVKSMGGERLSETELGPLGIPGDRELVVMDGRGRILDARAHPGLLRHHATLGSGGRVRVDGKDWEDPEVARWVRTAAGPDAHLTPHTGPERFDILPLLVTSDGAITALAVDHRRLRPNLVIGGVVGLAERGWEGRHLGIRQAVVALADLRGRCVMTNVDPETGVRDRAILQRIQQQFGGTFALNAWIAEPGRIRVGDPVLLMEAPDRIDPPRYGRYARRTTSEEPG